MPQPSPCGIQHVLVCGLGSIGRRHLRHVRALGVARVDAWRTGNATLPDEGQPAPDRVFRSLEEALASGPQAVIVANPTSMHLATARAAVRAGCHVLVEKPLSHSLDGIEDLRREAEAAGRVVAVGNNLRFHPLLGFAREHVLDPEGHLGPALHARIHFHAYIPAWHPWEDYRTSYAARQDLGGGAALTHIHEIDYALWLFGQASAFTGRVAPKHPLGTDVDESTSLLIHHAGGVQSNLSLSLCTRPPSRGFEIAFQDGTLHGDLAANTWRRLGPDGAAEEGRTGPDFNVDDTYRSQLHNFFDAIAGRALRPAVGLEDGLAALRIALCPVEEAGPAASI